MENIKENYTTRNNQRTVNKVEIKKSILLRKVKLVLGERLDKTIMKTNLKEMLEEFLGILADIPDDHEETTFITGYINEQLAHYEGSDFPLEEMFAIVKAKKPLIAMHIKITGDSGIRKLINTDLTEEEAIKKILEIE